MGLVVVVLLINGSLALACFYGAWRLWQWRSDLVQLRGTIGDAEQQLQQALAKAPLMLLQGQLELVTVRQRYVLPWQVRLQQTQRAIALVSFAISLWRRSEQRRRLTKRNRSKAQG